MIKSITLQNFQSHKDNTVDFCDGVNAIVGQSDSGKTAILRAINWVVNNKPTGEAFQSSWGGETIVSIALDSGVIVKRGRSASDNYYMIDDEAFRAFGQNVPIEVREAMNLEEINIEKQMDSPFLLGSSPGEVAKILNKIVDLEGIDSAISNIRREKMKADQEFRTEKVRWADTVEELKQYDYLISMEEDVADVEALLQQSVDTNKKIEWINRLIADMTKQETAIKTNAPILDMEKDVNTCQIKYDELKTNFRKMTAIKALVNKQRTIAQEITQHNRVLENEKTVQMCSNLLVQIKVHHTKLKKINSLLDNVDREDKKRAVHQVTIKKLESKFNDLMPDFCPLCGAT